MIIKNAGVVPPERRIFLEHLPAFLHASEDRLSRCPAVAGRWVARLPCAPVCVAKHVGQLEGFSGGPGTILLRVRGPFQEDYSCPSSAAVCKPWQRKPWDKMLGTSLVAS